MPKAKTPKINGRPVTMGELRAFVFRRDRQQCLAQRFIKGHVCTARWFGDRFMAPRDLTLEHVPSVHGPADTRRDDERHCVTLCYGSNVGAPSTLLREFLRDYLRELYPECALDLTVG